MANATCSEVGCGNPAKARGWCRKHYGKKWRLGLIQPELPLAPKHSLSQVDNEARTAVCAICGPVAIRPSRGERGPECMVKRRADDATRQNRTSYTYTAADRQRWKYKITAEQIADLMSSKSGMCHICGEAKATDIDHDHSCCPAGGSCGGCVRGALCHRCNIGLGWFVDDPDRMRAAADYIDRWSDKRGDAR